MSADRQEFSAVVQRVALAKALATVALVAKSNESLAILQHVLLRGDGQHVVVSATNLDLSVQAVCPAEVASGAAVLLGSKLHELAVALSAGPVTLAEQADNWVRLTAGGSDMRIAGLAVADFPTLPFDAAASAGVELPSSALRELIDRTIFACTDVEDSRYSLSGALLIIERDGVSMVATDGHRLSFAKRSVAIDVAEKQSVLVARVALVGLRRLAGATETIHFEQRSDSFNHLIFTAGGTGAVACKSIYGQFPAYERIVAWKGSKKFCVAAPEFMAAVKRVGLFSSERSPAMKLTLRRGEMELHASSPELGEARELLPVDYADSELEIGINPEYIADFLEVVGGSTVRVELQNPDSQALLVCESEGLDHRYVAMPMRL